MRALVFGQTAASLACILFSVSMRSTFGITANDIGFCSSRVLQRKGTSWLPSSARAGFVNCNIGPAIHPCCHNTSFGDAHHDGRYRKNSLLFSKSQGESDIDEHDSKNDKLTSNEKKKNHNWTPQTLAIALPALAGMMTDPLLSMVDTLFVGRLGYTSVGGVAAASSIPLAALGACTSIFHLSFHCFRATTLSTSSLVAGALVRDEQKETNDEDSSDDGNQKEAVLIAQTSIQQGIFTGVLISAVLLMFGPKCLLAMGISPSSSDQLYPMALTYLNHRAIAAPAVVMLAASEGIFRGYGDVITPWKVSCIVALLNLVLDPFCMFGGGGGTAGIGGGIIKRLSGGLGMGIKGAAVATAFSQVCGAFLYGRWLFQKGLLGKNDGSGLWKKFRFHSKRDETLGETNEKQQQQRVALKKQKRSIAAAIVRANAAMMAKQGSLLLGWAYATSRATRMGPSVVASHQMALSIWLVVAFVLEGAGVAAQVMMAKEWEGLKVLERKLQHALNNDEDGTSGKDHMDQSRRTVKSLSLYMIKFSLLQGFASSLAILILRQTAPSFILTQDPVVRQNLLILLPHIAAQMVLISVTLITEALAIGGGRFKWLAGGTTVSSIIAMVKLRGASDLVGIWSGGIVALFLGRLATASLAVMDMNGLFHWRERAVLKETA